VQISLRFREKKGKTHLIKILPTDLNQTFNYDRCKSALYIFLNRKWFADRVAIHCQVVFIKSLTYFHMGANSTDKGINDDVLDRFCCE
jgi:hypothetical protein